MDGKFHVIGIGASAGGQQALVEFLRNLPPDPDVALVVVTHLDHDHSSRLDVILARVSPLPTIQIHDGQQIEKNRLYVMPGNVFLTLKNGFFVLTPRRHAKNNAINIFFNSLAHDRKQCAVGIILSGCGTDGTAGVNEIHHHGGKVFIQLPESAAFSSMPESAIERDHPDAIATPEKLAQNIHTLLGQPTSVD